MPAYTPRNRSADLTHYVNGIPGVPPNTPASGYNISPRAIRERRHYNPHPRQMTADPAEPTLTPDLSHNVDLRSLAYVDAVDENLICPICHVAFVDPVDTECEHTFCRTCIAEALSHSETCPIDRSPLSRRTAMPRAHKIIINQLDALEAKCPCCEDHVPRSMLQNHLERYCKEALVKCPARLCNDVVQRKLSDKGCLHYETTCPDCGDVHQEIDMENHRECVCKDRQGECEHCGHDILRCKEREHRESCPDVTAPCQWADYGCQHESKRKDLHLHLNDCAFKLVGPMAELLKDEISLLRNEVRVLTEKDQLQERRIKFLESGQKDSDRPLDYSEISNLPETVNTEPLDSGHEYLLSLVEAQESRVGQLSAGMTELEARQTMMLFNETLSIKNELAEMRSAQQVIGMHVRMLLNFRKQDTQRRFGPGPAPGPGPGSSGVSDVGGSSNDSQLSRRLSDSMTKL